MEIHFYNDGLIKYLECKSGIENIEDAKTIIVSCVEHETDRVLILSQALPPAFYDLGSFFAGEFVQKLMNYRIRVAAVFESDNDYSERFREYLFEAKKGQQFRVFITRVDAISWLSSEK